jgi:hypothetical protein
LWKNNRLIGSSSRSYPLPFCSLETEQTEIFPTIPKNTTKAALNVNCQPLFSYFMYLQEMEIEHDNISDIGDTRLGQPQENSAISSISPPSPFLECNEKTRRMFFRDFKLLEKVICIYMYYIYHHIQIYVDLYAGLPSCRRQQTAMRHYHGCCCPGKFSQIWGL